MTTQTSYGSWATHGDHQINVETSVVVALGEFVEDFDVDGLVHAYREAINAALPTGMTLIGDEFIGPDPVDSDTYDDIAEAVGTVDFWALAPQFERA